ncbi:hypothetical protein LT85_2444 [Collimonas arenae]|uniref:DUF4148 domain-containing protein n=1 Tax=Collimonas arenae TaxID=279058 RepID=A0A0A1FFH3_9BURK|nr:DUF4148 domain-containing protein [Collimonas arenae]AIY41602.1 hypothetical protein LT85_2444 [Collimonas arenae]
MRTLKTIFTLLAFSATASAFAEASYPPEPAFTSTLTRAQVEQEVAKAQTAGVLLQSDASYPLVTTPAIHGQKPMMAQMREAAKTETGASIYTGA